jgi:DNA-directed RNA polymerase specialized sigma24 family protein
LKRDDHIDFFVIPDHQLAIHERLEAWSRWVRVRPHGWQVAPMFRHYRPDGWETRESRRQPQAGVNIPEAVEMEKAVSLLPEKHREAVRWYYVFPGNPAAVARRLAVNKAGLLDLVHTARAMLVNRLSD